MIDLRLAAEIGKSLLENNMALKSNYEDLLINNTPVPTPTNSSSLIAAVKQQQEEQEIVRQNEEEEIKEYEYVPANRTREAIVEILAKENSDLSLQLDKALSNQEKLDRTNSKKARQLETEIEFLQKSLDHATIKIQELEENRQKKTLTFKDSSAKLISHCNTDMMNTHANTCDEQHETQQQIWIDEKNKQLEQLKTENHHVLQSKAEIEKRLAATLQDLRVLKQQFHQFQFTIQDHENLKMAFEAQHLHIQELKMSLEEHRDILSKLRERGISLLSSNSSNSSSYDDNNSMSSISDDSYFKRKLKEDSIKRDNLLAELENAWFKHQSPSPPTKKSSIFLQPFQAIYNQLPNVDSALESIILKAGVVEKDALDDALSLIGRLENEYDHEKFLQEKRHIYYKEEEDYNYLDQIDKEQEDYYYDDIVQEDEDYYYYLQQQQQLQLDSEEEVPNGIMGYAKHAVKSMIYMTWRWLRFTLIIMVAIFISLKEGPDSLS
jgi:hypothetical protein